MTNKENLKKYWKQHLVHAGIGALAALCIVAATQAPETRQVIGLCTAGAVIMWGQYQYQRLSFKRKALNDPETTDTPGIDWKYTSMGFLLVAAYGAISTML